MSDLREPQGVAQAAACLVLSDGSVFHVEHILGHRRVTDVYLLALAVRNSGRLVTFDRGVPISAIEGAEKRHLVVLGDP